MELHTLIFIIIISYIPLVIAIRNLLKQNEELEDTLNDVIEGTRIKIENALQQMRDIDNREVFEKDDEVGSTFEQLKNIIEDLNQEL
jgi:competence protein ComGC